MRKKVKSEGLYVYEGFPDGARGKEPASQCRRHKRRRFDAWMGKDPLEKEMATHSSILAWRIPWTEEPGKLQSMELQRVGLDLGEASKQYVCVWLIHFATHYSCKATIFQ